VSNGGISMNELFEPPEPADEEIGAKPTLNAGSSDFSRGAAHLGTVEQKQQA